MYIYLNVEKDTHKMECVSTCKICFFLHSRIMIFNFFLCAGIDLERLFAGIFILHLNQFFFFSSVPCTSTITNLTAICCLLCNRHCAGILEKQMKNMLEGQGLTSRGRTVLDAPVSFRAGAGGGRQGEILGFQTVSSAARSRLPKAAENASAAVHGCCRCVVGGQEQGDHQGTTRHFRSGAARVFGVPVLQEAAQI